MIDKKDEIQIDKIIEEFQKSEESTQPHRGRLKIHSSFTEAMGKILKAKPAPKQPKKGKK